jgi:NTE family protein
MQVPPRLRLPFPRRREAPGHQPTRTLNLALQGGGAHGAFTWGVLERLLDDEELTIDAVSGASAGAVNAVLLAAGLMEDGPAGAKAKLEEFWLGLTRLASGGMELAPTVGLGLSLDGVRRSLQDTLLDWTMRTLSPYQVNPFDLNPLRDMLGRLVDFERLRRDAPMALHIGATDVATGQSRVFRGGELSREMILASACLPQIHHAVRIDDRYYWDGAYSANPPMLPLVTEPGAQDTLLVQIIPLEDATLPVRAPDILERVNRIVFGEPLRREMHLIARAHDWARHPLAHFRRGSGRLRRHRFHRIDATPFIQHLAPGSRLSPDRQLVARLRQDGHEAATAWLAEHRDAIGRHATLDLAAAFP